MSKYTFKKQPSGDDSDTTKLEYYTESDTLEDIVEDFERFLKGSGFIFESISINQKTDEVL